MPFRLTKGFVETLYFWIVGETCMIKVWFHFNSLPTWTIWTDSGRTLKTHRWKKNSNCEMMPTWLTTYIFNKPIKSYYVTCLAYGSGCYLGVAWHAGMAFSSSSGPAQLLPDKTKPPGMYYSALCQARSSCENTHDTWVTKEQRYRWRWPWMYVSSSKNGQGVSFNFLLSQHPVISWPWGACVRVWGGGEGQSPFWQGFSLSGSLQQDSENFLQLNNML